ncbi:hypothetical protein [Gracilibacillus sp. YIM 98692]|uniref:hypothetical protein n=1 Tax=Gracilibacillus sp. YIM 98692 TaxID=2663532 RepID=UPI0013D4F52D|nr:hypothetical protein [Gracilibacillus sp. YIM 98692]
MAKKVKMLVQTTYNKQLLREGKVYEINDETARRWEVSKIAAIISSNQQSDS